MYILRTIENEVSQRNFAFIESEVNEHNFGDIGFVEDVDYLTY